MHVYDAENVLILNTMYILIYMHIHWVLSWRWIYINLYIRFIKKSKTFYLMDFYIPLSNCMAGLKSVRALSIQIQHRWSIAIQSIILNIGIYKAKRSHMRNEPLKLIVQFGIQFPKSINPLNVNFTKPLR